MDFILFYFFFIFFYKPSAQFQTRKARRGKRVSKRGFPLNYETAGSPARYQKIQNKTVFLSFIFFVTFTLRPICELSTSKGRYLLFEILCL